MLRPSTHTELLAMIIGVFLQVYKQIKYTCNDHDCNKTSRSLSEIYISMYLLYTFYKMVEC